MCQFKFARKILKKETTLQIDWERERESLRVFTKQRHPNIIRALCFFQWLGYINFVFPFAEGTLEGLLYGGWKGPDKISYTETGKNPSHWLWTQMIGVADGLAVIHNPRRDQMKGKQKEGEDLPYDQHENPSKQPGWRSVGFHFDLKPANILITDSGELKISDFGLSWIKRVSPNSQSYGNYRGGAPRYQAPEVDPMNIHFINSSTSAQTNESTVEEYKNSYDVWSYSCIVLEVMLFLLEENRQAKLEQFEIDMTSEIPEWAFYTAGKLKSCVDTALKQLEDRKIGSEGSPYEIWVKKTVEYLRKMFSIQPQARPSSTAVAEQFRVFHDEYTKEPSDELRRELDEFGEQEFPKKTFDQVYWSTSEEIQQPFLMMSVVHCLQTVKPTC